MQKTGKYIWLGLFLGISLLTIIAEYKKSDYSSLGDFIYGLLYMGCMLLSIPLLISWNRQFSMSKKYISLLPLFLPLLLFASIVTITAYRNDRRDKPVFLSAGMEGLRIELRTDSTYRISAFGEFSADSYYGGFTTSNDTILLHNCEFGYNRFVINKTSIDSLHQQGYLIAENENNNFKQQYPIYIDKR